MWSEMKMQLTVKMLEFLCEGQTWGDVQLIQSMAAVKRAASCIFKGKHRAECASRESYFRIMWQAEQERRLGYDLRDIWWFIVLFSSVNQKPREAFKHLQSFIIIVGE